MHSETSLNEHLGSEKVSNFSVALNCQVFCRTHSNCMPLTSKATCRDVRHSNPIISFNLSQLHSAPLWNYRRSLNGVPSDDHLLLQTFLFWNILFLDKIVLNKMQQQESTCATCMYKFYHWGKSFAKKIIAGTFFSGTFLGDCGKNTKLAKIRTRKNVMPHSRRSVYIHEGDFVCGSDCYLTGLQQRRQSPR